VKLKDETSAAAGSALAVGLPTMTPGTRQTAAERLWSSPDGTFCILEERDTAPVYTISLIRDAEVVRQQRLFSKATAEMVALSWSQRSGSSRP
jgi:hypothetical protein